MEKELLDLGGRSDLWNCKMVLGNIGDGFNDVLIGSSLKMNGILCIIVIIIIIFETGYVEIGIISMVVRLV